MNGKGSKRRTEDYKRFSENWEKINWRNNTSFAINCIEYDQNAKSAYVYLYEKTPNYTMGLITVNVESEKNGPIVNIDYLGIGKIFGIEICFIDSDRLVKKVKLILKEKFPNVNFEFPKITFV